MFYLKLNQIYVNIFNYKTNKICRKINFLKLNLNYVLYHNRYWKKLKLMVLKSIHYQIVIVTRMKITKNRFLINLNYYIYIFFFFYIILILILGEAIKRSCTVCSMWCQSIVRSTG